MGWKVRISIQYSRRSYLVALIMVGGAVVAFLGFLVWGQAEVTAGVQSPSVPQAPEVASTGMRQYYLTQDIQIDGNEALAACAEGYHMASIWEIVDPSNLRYNVNLGRTQADSGFGAISEFEGWVRTGYNNDISNVAGQGNCAVWSSDSGSAYGTSAYLPAAWTGTVPNLHVWKTNAWSCDTQMPVWCVADEVDSAGTCSLPQPLLTCGQQVSGDTTGRASHIDIYGCVGWDESGPDVLYSLDLPATFAPYTVTATLSDLSVDLDVFILPTDGCYPGECLAYDDLSAHTSGVAGGTYYIAVDGYSGNAGSYTLSVDCGYRKVFAPLVLRDYE